MSTQALIGVLMLGVETEVQCNYVQSASSFGDLNTGYRLCSVDLTNLHTGVDLLLGLPA